MALARLDHAGVDFTKPEWAYAKGGYLRIYAGTGFGQVAEIDDLQNGFITIKQVWKMPNHVADPGAGPGPTACVLECLVGRREFPPQADWFETPDSTGINSSKYVLVAGTRFWEDGSGADVPAIITAREVKADGDLWRLNQKAQDRINNAKVAIQNAAGQAVTFFPVPDIFMGQLAGSPAAIKDRTSIAFMSGLANLQPVAGRIYLAEGFGPRNAAGTDVIKEDAKAQLPFAAADTVFVDAWDSYHRKFGQVHCGTNVKRKIDGVYANWWKYQR